MFETIVTQVIIALAIVVGAIALIGAVCSWLANR